MAPTTASRRRAGPIGKRTSPATFGLHRKRALEATRYSLGDQHELLNPAKGGTFVRRPKRLVASRSGSKETARLVMSVENR